MDQPSSLLALTGALPALIAMAYVDRLDSKRPEPVRTLRRVAIFGALSVIPVAAIAVPLAILGAQNLDPMVLAIFNAFLVAGLIEEVGKFAVVRLVVWNRDEFDERMDGIVYATRAGLGFALIENILYLSSVGTFRDFITLFFLRAVLAVPMHAITAGIMGYYAARKRFDGTGPGVFGGLFWAVFIHGTYDAALFLVQPLYNATGSETLVYILYAVPAVVVIGGGVTLRRLARTAVRLDDMATALTGSPSTRIDENFG